MMSSKNFIRYFLTINQSFDLNIFRYVPTIFFVMLNRYEQILNIHDQPFFWLQKSIFNLNVTSKCMYLLYFCVITNCYQNIFLDLCTPLVNKFDIEKITSKWTNNQKNRGITSQVLRNISSGRWSGVGVKPVFCAIKICQ